VVDVDTFSNPILVIEDYTIEDLQCNYESQIITFGDPILVIEDYTIEDLQCNDESQMITVIVPFAKAWPNKFMSSY